MRTGFVAAVVCALAACGQATNAGPGVTLGNGGGGGILAEGGSGGSGGNGGAGGGGEQGGSGGSAPAGTCEDPIDYLATALHQAQVDLVAGNTGGNASTLVGSCGGTGNEVVYRYVPTAEGVLAIQGQSPGAIAVYARRTCDDRSTEATCLTGTPGSGSTLSGRIDVHQGEPIYLVVDAPSGVDASFRLLSSLHPYAQGGVQCDPTGAGAVCVEQAFCDATGPAPVCKPGTAPVITEVAYRPNTGGSAVFVRATDADGDISTVRIDFLDASGNPVAVDYDGDGIAETQVLEVGAASFPFAETDGSSVFLAGATSGLEQLVPRFRITVGDSAGLLSAPSDIDYGLVIRKDGQTCDSSGLLDQCDRGLLCAPGEGFTCQDSTTARQSECDGAPLLVSGQPLQLSLAESLHDAPAACSSKPGQSSPPGTVEGVAHLHLDATAARVTITPVTPTDTQVYLLPGCGLEGLAALGCADDDGTSLQAPLVLSNVPAGDYLLVVDSWNYLTQAATVTATIE